MHDISENVAGTTESTGLDDFHVTARYAQHEGFDAVANGALRPYKVVLEDGGDEYERGLGTWNAATSRLQRTTVKRSSSGVGVKHNFSAGTKVVMLVADKEYLAHRLEPDSNLSDLDDPAAARANLGLDAIYTSGEQAKLSGIEPGATDDQTGAEIKVAYEGENNTNAFTDAEKSKLAGLESSKFLGTYTTLGALQTAHPSPAEGSFAHVDAGVGQDVTIFIWDNDDSQYVEQAAGSSSETAASIKAKYESNPDTNVFDDSEKAKLAGIEAAATADQSPIEIRDAYESNANRNPFTDTEQTKLAGVEPGATADQTGAEIKAAYESENDTNAFTDAEKSKLAGVEGGATADQTGAEIKAAYEGESNTNAFTDSEKSKLAGLESSKFLGTYTTLGALQTAHPSPAEGSYAHVDAGVGQEVAVYIWDDNDSSYHQQAAASSAETAASVKAKYESNPDTNAYSDAEQAKLSGVEPGATADQTGAEIKAAYEGESNTNAFTDGEQSKLAGIEPGATGDQSGAEIKSLYEGEADTNALTDVGLRKLNDSAFVFGLDREDDGPIVIFAACQSIGLSDTPYRNGPYPVNNRMYDYQYIGPGNYGFVQGPDLSAPLRADYVAGVAVGMLGGGNGDVFYGMARRLIEKHDRDVYVCKLAIGGASIASLEATHWDNGTYVDSTPGDFYNLLEQHFTNARALLAGVTDAPAYPDYFVFTQGATNAMKVDPLTQLANPDYLPPLEWTERAFRLFSLWDNPNALDYISRDDSRIVLLDLPPFRSWDYTGDHMRMLSHVLGERAMLISQGERPLHDFVHPTGDGGIDLGDDIARTTTGEMAHASREPGWRTARNKTNLAYTTYLREPDGAGDVTEDLRWRYDSTNDLLIVSPTDGAQIDWGWLDVRAEDHYKFEETADSDRSVLFRATGRHTFDPADVYQLRIPVVVVTVGSSGWPRVGEALTSSLTDSSGNANHLNEVYAGDGDAPMETDENIRLNRLGLVGSSLYLQNLRDVGDTSLITVDVDGNVKRSPLSSQGFGAEIVGLSSLLNPTLGGVGAEPGVVKRIGFKCEMYGFRADSGVTDEVWKAKREGVVYFSGSTAGLVPAASDIHAESTQVVVDTGTATQDIHVEGFIGALTVRPTGIAGQTWRYRSKFEWEII